MTVSITAGDVVVASAGGVIGLLVGRRWARRARMDAGERGVFEALAAIASATLAVKVAHLVGWFGL
jgi:hypothetical protein